MKRIVFFLWLGCLGSFSFAQTLVTADLSGSNTWTVSGSPYQILSPISLLPGSILNIDPGVEVEFGSSGKLVLQGFLQVHGSAQDSVSFRGINGLTNAGSYLGLELAGGSAFFRYASCQGASDFLKLVQGNSATAEFSHSLLSNHTRAIDLSPSNQLNFLLDSCLVKSTRLRIDSIQSVSFQRVIFEDVQDLIGNEMLIRDVENCQIKHSVFRTGSGLRLQDCPGSVMDQDTMFGGFLIVNQVSQPPAVRTEITGGEFWNMNVSLTGVNVTGAECVGTTINSVDGKIENCRIDWQDGNNGWDYVGLGVGNTDVIGCTILGDGGSPGSAGVYLNPGPLGTTVGFVDNQVLNFRTGVDMQSLPAGSVDMLGNTICNDSANLVLPTGVFFDITDNCWCTDDTTHAQSLILPPGSSYQLLPMDSSCLADLVFPGDADASSLVDMQDLLAIGLAFDSTGPIRPGASLSWTGQYVDDWSSSLASGANFKHADTDGSGWVNFDDTLAINLNYGLSYSSNKTQLTGTPLYFPDFPSNIQGGDTLYLSIHLGKMDSLAEEVYGLAFSLSYDTSQVVPQSVKTIFSPSWLGVRDQTLLAMGRDSFELGQIDLGMVRNDHTPVTGFGPIAHLVVVLEDDIAKKEESFALHFEQLRMIDAEGQELGVNAQDGLATISTSRSPLLPAASLQVFPLPTDDLLRVQSSRGELLDVKFWDFQGRLVQGNEMSHTPYQKDFSLGHLPAGNYLLEILTSEGHLRRKILLLP